MAQSVGAIALDIVMGKNTVSGVAKQAIADVQKTFNDGTATIGNKVSAVGQACTAMGAAVMPASTAVAALGGSMVKTAADFDSAMSEVSAISGATGKDFDALRDKAQEMGAKTKFSASQSAEAMKYMAMAGWKTEDMLNGISGVMNLAAASGEDLATTSDIVTDALTAFGLSASDSGHFADVLAAASSNANTNVGMMGETFKYVAPVAGAMGYSVEDMSVAIGLMANSGIKGSQAGTALRSVVTRLAKPTKESANAMEALGLSITNSDGTMKSFNQIMLDMRGAFAGLTEDEQAFYAAQLGGQEAMSGLLAIVNASESDFNKLSSAINNADGTAEKMANTMNDNLNGRLTLLKSQLDGIAIEIGESLTPIIDVCISAVSNFATWFSNLDDTTKKVIVTIGVVVAALGPVLLIIGGVISGVGSVISVIGTLGGALGGLTVLFNPITLAIGAVVAAGAVLIANWDSIKELAGMIGESISNAWSDLKTKTSETWNSMKAKTSETLNSIKTNASTTWSNIKSTVSNAANNAKTTATNAFNNMKSGISNAGAGIKSAVSGVFNNVKSTIKNFASQAVSWGKDFVDGLARGIRNTASKVTSAAKGLGEKIKSYLHFSRPDVGPLRDYETWMPDFVQGMANGINANKHKVVDAVKGMASQMSVTANPSIGAVNTPKLKNVGNAGTQQAGYASDDRLYNLLSQMLAKMQDNGDITIPIYLGNDLIDERIIRANDRRTVRSGGRA